MAHSAELVDYWWRCRGLTSKRGVSRTDRSLTNRSPNRMCTPAGRRLQDSRMAEVPANLPLQHEPTGDSRDGTDHSTLRA